MYTYLGQSDPYNPPDFWQSMITDPTVPPHIIYPYGSSGYGYPGLYAGQLVGQRAFTYADMQRELRRRQQFLERRADISEDPSHRYLTPEGRLKGPAGSVLRALRAKKPEQKDVVKDLQKKIITTVLIGAVLSAILK